MIVSIKNSVMSLSRLLSACIVLSMVIGAGSAVAKEKDTHKPSDDIKVFDVAIDEETMAGLKRLPWEFDYSVLDVWTELNAQNCRFQINRRMLENKRLEQMAGGTFNVVDGTVMFASHSWRTGGMANADYLKYESNLKILRDGRPAGKMPYFHLFINKGEVALPPVFVELTREREAGAVGSISGAFSFYVDEWQDGLLEISNC